jgi:hypothetical protein
MSDIVFVKSQRLVLGSETMFKEVFTPICLSHLMSSQDSNGCRASEMVESAFDYFLDTYQKYGERFGDSPGSTRVLERMQDLGQFLRLEMGPEGQTDDMVFEDEVRQDSPSVREEAEGPVRGRKSSSEEPDQEEQPSHRRRLDEEDEQVAGEDGERSAGERSGNDQVDEDGPQVTLHVHALYLFSPLLLNIPVRPREQRKPTSGV